MAHEKLKAAMAYLADKTHPGKTKLFKLLYLADATAFGQRGAPITDESYVHYNFGPAPQTLLRSFSAIAAGCVEVEAIDMGSDMHEQRMRAKPSADLSPLSDSDRAILDEVILEYGQMSGSELRRLTHEEIPYRVTAKGEPISYYLAAYRNAGKPTRQEIDRIAANAPLMERLRNRILQQKGR